MITAYNRRKRRRAGVAMADCLVFIGVFSLLLSMSFIAYGRLAMQSKRLHQNASDIVQAVKAGERWREDVRAATGPIRLEKKEGLTVATIPQQTGEVSYLFD